MLPFPHTPTFYEWVALIHDDPARARRHMLSLQAQLENQGLMAAPALTLSIEEFERARSLFDSHMTPQQTELINNFRRIGLAVLFSYPDEDDWRQLITDDPAFARKVVIALETKQALMGLQTPQIIIKSIELYQALTK